LPLFEQGSKPIYKFISSSLWLFWIRNLDSIWAKYGYWPIQGPFDKRDPRLVAWLQIAKYPYWIHQMAHGIVARKIDHIPFLWFPYRCWLHQMMR